MAKNGTNSPAQALTQSIPFTGILGVVLWIHGIL